MERRFVLVALVLIALLGCLGPAQAHENRLVGEGSVTVGAGEALEFPVELHYHRLVGSVEVLDPDAGEVLVNVVGPGSPQGDSVAGPGAQLVVNALVPCCKDATWSPHTVVIENPGAAAVQVEYRLVLLHDGIAVIAEDAEPGALVSTLAPFVIVSVIFGLLLGRGAPRTGRSMPWATGAAGAHLMMWLVAGAMGLGGMLRYAGGPVSGAIAVAADLPWLSNPIITTQDLVLGSGMILWAVSVGAWTAAVRRAPGEARLAWLGIALGSGSILACGLWVLDYGYILAPLLVGLASAALPLAGGVLLLVRGDAHSSATPS